MWLMQGIIECRSYKRFHLGLTHVLVKFAICDICERVAVSFCIVILSSYRAVYVICIVNQ